MTISTDSPAANAAPLHPPVTHANASDDPAISPALEFAQAIFPPGTSIDDIPFCDADGNPKPLSEATHLSPRIGDDLYFSWAADLDTLTDDYLGNKLIPTAVLHKAGISLYALAFDRPEAADACADVTAALDMSVPDEPIPLPDHDGWVLIHADQTIFHPLETQRVTYVLADDVSPAVPETEEAVEIAMYGDAVKKGVPYVETDFAFPITLSMGAAATTNHYPPQSVDAGHFFARLCQHRERKDKEGPAYVTCEFAEGIRAKSAVMRVWGVSLDYDTGDTADEVDAAIAPLEWSGVRFTTHSHMKTSSEFKCSAVEEHLKTLFVDDEGMRRYLREVKHWKEHIVERATIKQKVHTRDGLKFVVEHPAIEKHRVVFLFKTPFEIAVEGMSQNQRIEMAELIYDHVAARVGLHHDVACRNLAQPHYFPAHAKGRPFSVSIFGGAPIDWTQFEPAIRLEQASAKIGSGNGKAKSVTAEGLALKVWASLGCCQTFDMEGVIKRRAPTTKVRKAREGTGIECPHRDGHSTEDDSKKASSCHVVSPCEGRSELFTAPCRHTTCRKYTMLDQLGKMLKDKWFGIEVIFDPKNHITVLGDDGKPVLDLEKLAKLKDQMLSADDWVTWNKSADVSEDDTEGVPSLTVAEVEKMIDALANDDKGEEMPINLDELEAVLKKISAQSDGGSRTKLYTAAKSRLKKPHHDMVAESIKAAKVRWKEAAKEERAQIKPDTQAGKILKALNATAPCPIVLTSDSDFGTFSLTMKVGTPWITMLRGDGNAWEPVCTVLGLVGGIKQVDRKGKRGYRVLVHTAEGDWDAVDLDGGKVATKSGGDSIERLGDAGMAVAPGMQDRVMGFIGSCQPKAINVFHRPGLRVSGKSKGYLLPTGQTMLTDKPMELSSDVKLKGVQQAGSLGAYREGMEILFGLDNAIPQQFCYCAGLAGALTEMAGVAPLMYSLEGLTGSSKSTSQSLAVSHWGNPALGKGLFIRGISTPGALESIFEIFTGTCGAMDEVTGMPVELLQYLAYLAEGRQGRFRLKRGGETQLPREWGGQTFIISAEVGFAQRMEQESLSVLGGVSARMLAIAVSEKNRIGGDAYKAIQATLAANFGLSGPAFITAADADGYYGDPVKIREAVDDLIAKLPQTQGVENVQRARAARLVAYPWLAAIIAKKIGLIPAGFDVDALMAKIWSAALKSDLAPVAPAVAAAQMLCDNLVALKGTSVVDYSGLDEAHREAWGYFDVPAPKGYDEKGFLYVVRADKIAKLSGGAADKEAILKQLENRGLLLRKKAGNRITWNGFPKLGKETSYIVLKASGIDSDGGDNVFGDMLANALAPIAPEYEI